MHPVAGHAYLNIHVCYTDMPFHVLTTSLTWAKSMSEIPKPTPVYTVLHANKQRTLVPHVPHVLTHTHAHMYSHTCITDTYLPTQTCTRASAHSHTHSYARCVFIHGSQSLPQLQERRSSLCPQACGDQRVQCPTTVAHQGKEACVCHRGDSRWGHGLTSRVTWAEYPEA